MDYSSALTLSLLSAVLKCFNNKISKSQKPICYMKASEYQIEKIHLVDIHCLSPVSIGGHLDIPSKC